VIEDPNVGETKSVGVIGWQPIATGVGALWALNHQPNAQVVNPAIATDLCGLTSSDGTNSARLWLEAPPNVAELQRFITSNCPLANIVIGDFSKMALGLQYGARVEMTTVGGDSFAKHQVLVKSVFRGDCCRLDPTAFHGLSGIRT
jgi:hypothetical protein